MSFFSFLSLVMLVFTNFLQPFTRSGSTRLSTRSTRSTPSRWICRCDEEFPAFALFRDRLSCCLQFLWATFVKEKERPGGLDVVRARSQRFRGEGEGDWFNSFRLGRVSATDAHSQAFGI